MVPAAVARAGRPRGLRQGRHPRALEGDRRDGALHPLFLRQPLVDRGAGPGQAGGGRAADLGRRHGHGRRAADFMGVRCPSCRKVYVPPRPLCGPCYRTIDEWVEVGPRGTLAAFTILRFAFLDPETGRRKPVPYGYGFIRLDGADTQLQHFLRIDPQTPPRIGMKVKPVFEDERAGTLRDIRHFEAA
ncbi:MAG: OB-fold domain-containing protein [Elusimicrobia bacterium]|nr:OB-fold domain-containing protein [Elusimicrobiota bacterium]